MLLLPRLVVALMVLITTTAGERRTLQDTLKIQTLRNSLLQNYNKEDLPPTPAVINLLSLTIRDMEMFEGSHRINLHGWISYTWKDERLSWKAEDYGGLKKLSFSPDDIWLPDLTVYNAGHAEATVITSKFRVIVDNDGTILHVPSFNFHFSCVADLTYWPHDTHNCSLKLGSWVHSTKSIDIKVENSSIEMEVTQNSEKSMDTLDWKILDKQIHLETKMYDCCSEPYVNVKIDLMVKRNAPAYCWIIKTPVVCLVLLMAVVFLLPPAAGEKVTLAGLNIILCLLFLFFTHSTVRNAPSHTPIIVQLISIQLVMGVACLFVAALVVKASTAPFSSSPSASLHHFALTLAPIIGLAAYVKQASGSGQTGPGTPKSDEVELGNEVESGRTKEQNVAGQWILLGAVLDRLSLGIYLIISLIMLIRSSSVL